MEIVPDKLRVYRHPQHPKAVVMRFVGEVETVEEAAELCRKDSEERGRFARYEVRRSQTVAEIVTNKFRGYGYQPIVLNDRENPGITDEEIFARFADVPEVA